MSIDSIDHYYRADVREGPVARPAYFYSTTGGLYDITYGWAGNTSRMNESLTAAIEKFRGKLQAKHVNSGDGGTVTVSDPSEVTKDEIDRQSPLWGALVQRATDVIDQESNRSLDRPDQHNLGLGLDRRSQRQIAGSVEALGGNQIGRRRIQSGGFEE